MFLGKYSSNFPQKDCDGKGCPVTIYRALINYPLMVDSFGFQENSASSQRRQWHPTPVLLPGKSYGRRSLVGCILGVTKSQTRLSDFTFTLHFHALEKEMATHSSVLAWRTPGMGELLSMRSHRVGHD